MQPLNRFVSDVVARLPYSLRNAVLYIIHAGLFQRPPFHGVYERFDEINSTYSAAYPTAEAAEAFVKAGLSLKREKAAGLVILRRGHWLLPTIVGLLAKRDGPLRILDFGGSGGVDFTALKQTTDARLQYDIVEMPEVCEAARKLWPKEADINFRETLPEGGQYDVVYSWSAIHYVSDPLDLLAKFTAYGPKAVLIVHSPFAQRAFVRAQVRGSATLPHWVISLPEAERVMRERGYRLAMRATDEFTFNVDNYDAEHRVPHMANLLFVRE